MGYDLNDVSFFQIEMEYNRRKLQERHMDIVKKLSEGKTAKEIAEMKRMSHRTVESHITELRKAYAAKNIPHLITILFRIGKLK